MTIYIGPARNKEEMIAARDLAVKTFSPLTPNKTRDQITEFKDFLWNENGSLKLENIIVVASEDRVVGTVRLVFRNLYFGIDSYYCAGVSSVCIAEEYRGKKLSLSLMEATLEQAKLLGCEVVLLFARRALDHYYPKFGIWGLSSYNNIRVSMSSVTTAKRQTVTLKDVESSNLHAIQQWHALSYGNCFGYIERSYDYWQFLIEKFKCQSIAIKAICDDGNIIGYAVISDELIMELAFEPKENYDVMSIIGLLAGQKGFLDMQLPEKHPIVGELTSLDITVSHRECEYGGHMLGILNEKKVYRKFEDKLKRNAIKLGLKPLKERVDGLCWEWDGHDVTVQLTEPQKKLGVETTARLLGARLVSRYQNSYLAPCESVNFSSPDHF
ncbi:hypothetical protein A9Q79_07940 [Methylophaga sp. 42_25_T18]|nr:hypothetical protein A9Q79_07940 [Methylophaga sp. 42_25_T18]